MTPTHATTTATTQTNPNVGTRVLFGYVAIILRKTQTNGVWAVLVRLPGRRGSETK